MPPIDLSRKRICFVAGTLGQGGAERQLYHILQALCSVGVQPSVITFARDEFWHSRIEALGVPVHWLGAVQSRQERWVNLFNLVKKLDVDILQSQHFYTNAYTGLTARMLRRVGIGALRADGDQEVRSVGSTTGWLSLTLPHWIVANSQQAICAAKKHHVPEHRFYFLPNTVDSNHFHSPGRTRSEPVNLLTIARLTPQKRIDRLLEICALLSTDGLHYRARIVGGGACDSQLKTQAVQLGLFPGRVEFTGSIPDPLPYYQDSNIFLLTSDWEGTPNVILEAMACGLPVVAPRVGGVPDLIQDGITGILLEKADIPGYAAAIRCLAGDTELRMRLGSNARAAVLEKYSPQALKENLVGFYQRALV